MKLLELSVENFRGAPDGTYSFVHPITQEPLPFLVLTGGASSGKTALLDAVVALKESVGSYGVHPAPERFLRYGATTGRIQGRWQISAEEMARAKIERSIHETVLTLGA